LDKPTVAHTGRENPEYRKVPLYEIGLNLMSDIKFGQQNYV
jgi:hypothetical protein